MAIVKEMMSKKLLAIPVGESLSKAFKLMAENRIRHLPVVDKSDTIVGVLSSKDFPSFGDLRDGLVEFYMNAPVIHVRQDVALKKAVYKMLESKISSLIVTDENDEAVGIITTDDMLWYLVTRLEKDSIDEKKSIFSRIFDLDTVGKVANQISLAGI
jgi:CBS domain-containing protein